MSDLDIVFIFCEDEIILWEKDVSFLYIVGILLFIYM